MNENPQSYKRDSQILWHSQSVEEIFRILETAREGLAISIAAERLIQDGNNAIKSTKRISHLQIFIGQFKSVIVWVLIGAGLISIILGDFGDGLAIFSIIVLNCAIGFYQESSAARSMNALQNMTSPQAKVKRSGKVTELPSSEVVAGDILMFEAGDIIAADGRLLESSLLGCNESALTGESEISLKSIDSLSSKRVALAERSNMVFMGTSVAIGMGQAIVVTTGMRSELGLIAGMMKEARPNSRTPLQKKLDDVGHILIGAALGIVLLLFGLGLYQGTDLLTLTVTSISLAVAAIPEGLPAIVTVVLSMGVMRMARRGALVRNLASVETLGSTSVICTDKTGTLTLGQMTVRELYISSQSYQVTGEGYGEEGEVQLNKIKVSGNDEVDLRILTSAFVACSKAKLSQNSDERQIIGDPTEGALLVAGKKLAVSQEELDKQMPVHCDLPFDSSRKRSAVIRRTQDGTLRVQVNGAPGPLLELCRDFYIGKGIRPLEREDRQLILAEIDRMASSGLRVLGAAGRDLKDDAIPFESSAVERDLTFYGLAGMHDAPRPEAKAAILKCRSAGIKVVMITGDHALTATAIAQELGINLQKPAMTGDELDQLSPEEFVYRMPEISVFAGVSASHKLRIVDALKAGGAVVAMTGDGVNDAPAIQGADIGIAMGKTGTEVTKQAADIVITDDNFGTIVAAVEEGRGIYQNIRKSLQYLLAGNTGELILMMVCALVALPSPLLPIHLLWINLVTDGLPALCLALGPLDSDLMSQPPRGRNEKMMDRSFFLLMALSGALIAAVTFAVYVFMLGRGSLEQARTYAFTVLIFAELFRSFGLRSEMKNIWNVPLRSNMRLVYVCLGAFLFQLWSQHEARIGSFLKTGPISLQDCLVLLLIGFIPLLVLELVKGLRKTWAKWKECDTKHLGSPLKQ